MTNRRGEGTHFVSFETQEHLFSILILGWKVVSSCGSFYSCCYPTCSLSLHIVAPLFITFEEIIRAEGFAIQFSYPVATYTGLPVKKGMGGGGHSYLTFSEIVLCQGCFPGNSLLCYSPRHPKLFWPRHSQNLVGGPSTGVSFLMKLNARGLQLY